jgi:hypothetical protein
MEPSTDSSLNQDGSIKPSSIPRLEESQNLQQLMTTQLQRAVPECTKLISGQEHLTPANRTMMSSRSTTLQLEVVSQEHYEAENQSRA